MNVVNHELSGHMAAKKWGEGAGLRAQVAKRLTRGQIRATLACIVDDVATGGLFAPLTSKRPGREHEPLTMSIVPVMSMETRRHIHGLFEKQKNILFCSQTYKGWADKTESIFGEIYNATGPQIWELKDSKAAKAAFIWAFRSYSLLLAPWSPVTLRARSVGNAPGRGFAITTSTDLQCDEFIYELSGMISPDMTPNRTDLSVIWRPPTDKMKTRKKGKKGKPQSKRALLIGAARLVNHSSEPNAEFVHINGTKGFTIQTNQVIEKGKEIFVDYGQEYELDFADEQCDPYQLDYQDGPSDKIDSTHAGAEGNEVSYERESAYPRGLEGNREARAEANRIRNKARNPGSPRICKAAKEAQEGRRAEGRRI
ncbi:hypothetical protein C8R43DRAFT_1128047 [Mycena crocata]|nr:hypothetical protein C8R43DRAFT_1128047 [Mycena crocata]